MTICVLDLCGPFCVDAHDGHTVCGIVGDALARHDSVCLDFSNVRMLSTAFFNASVGCLYGLFPLEFLREKLTTRGLDKTDGDLLALVQESATSYYGATDDARNVIDDASTSQLTTC